MIESNIALGDDLATRHHTQAILACSDPEIQQLLISVLSELGLRPALSKTIDDAEALLAREETAMVFSQPWFREGSFREVLRAAESPGQRVPVIVCSEFYDRDLYIEAMASGAFDYLAFPYRREEVAWVVNNALNWGCNAQGSTATAQD